MEKQRDNWDTELTKKKKSYDKSKLKDLTKKVENLKLQELCFQNCIKIDELKLKIIIEKL